MLTPEFLHQLKLTSEGIAELYCSKFLISNNFTLHVSRKWIEGKVTIIKMKKSRILYDGLVHIPRTNGNVQLLVYTMYDVNKEWQWQYVVVYREAL